MKNSIPSDVWERKKALIASLYKDEEWPLKQVIKKIRSEDFNPSETQLRSRLKKWRVTKPSRQTRKKSHEEPVRDDSGREEASPKRHSNNPSLETQTRSQPQTTTTDLSVTEPEWYMTNGVYEHHSLPTTISLDGPNIPNIWASTSSHPSPLSQPSKSRVSSTGSLVISTSNPYNPSHTSPLVDGALLNPTPALTPTFPDASYESCIQTPVSGPSIQWSVPQWYSLPLTAGSRGPSIPYYTAAPLSPPIDPTMHMMHPPAAPQLSEFHERPKSWKRNMSIPYGPEIDGHTQASQKRSKFLERKTSLPSKISASQASAGVMTPRSPFFPHGQHSILCSPGYHYPGAEPLVHRPHSIDF
ncbi:hypothetical protein P175DRAFT_0492794 [Aspergillus ochraceoroseus IBT 24754]|uniref:Clr5 domain-containing protein n=3 Tax=Aspergillus subgen. Nidulantes TaxID=2720870 RepID=A0A0F8UYS7_9EURO|nr:uncharacterized protein P175DRAFT_0492794 [Aspergillus ochraceoroseus IBT 24754]KKK16679.1 hypothetical protein AOCH_007396 [Aspergillus ochraceoroseus]KKK24629.1 hypothetical protein ARAM_006799 [Aspergillus rambellii]PTU22210.1 hypothetical protein P175DRAFT_0492794 [Aspergillus ochraceoroseus IBT 24754]